MFTNDYLVQRMSRETQATRLKEAQQRRLTRGLPRRRPQPAK